MRRRIAACILAAIALAGCGGGPTVTERRDLHAFTGIDVDHSMDVTVRRGARPAAVVRAGENVIDDVHTRVKDGTLQLRGRGDAIVIGSDPVDDAEVTLTVPRLDRLDVGGSGNVTIDRLAGDALTVNVDGSADVRAAGSVERLAIEIDGSADLDLRDLAAERARVDVSGSGEVRLGRTAELEVDVSGSAKVTYRGRPRIVSQNVSGSAEIEPEG